MGIDLRTPPEIVNSGRALHGNRRSVDIFRLHDLWSLHIYTYDADLIVDGEYYLIRPGTVSLVPPGAVTEFRYRGPSRHLFAHLRAASVEGGCEDLLYSPGRQLPEITAQLDDAIASATVRPHRARALVWLVLLTLSEQSLEESMEATRDHVSTAMSFIDVHLAEHLTVPEIASIAGVSQTYLTRLFRARTGMTVVGYLRHRRIQRAQHLLSHSTMSVAAVAASVGIHDLHVFNKTCREIAGASPRQLRQAR